MTATEAELAAGLARRYRIIRRLGGGGMGTVFLAEQIAVGNRPVALKVLLRKLLDDPEFLMRFHNEAASTGRIHHPNVVTVYESGQADDGTPYIAMEYLEGGTLRDELKDRGALSVAEMVEIIQQVARGLNAAHRLGIIHRDLKPDNIFLTRGDEGELAVKIGDFGIAKLRESATHTITGTVLGTPAYMSFEQAAGVKSDELDARSDIYSLGVVVYEMLTGRVPFHSGKPLGCVRKHLTEQPPPFRAVKPELPALPQVEKAVMQALTKNREQRFASALEFARALAEAARGPQLPLPLPQARVVPPVLPQTTAPSPSKPSAAPPPGQRATSSRASRAKYVVFGFLVLAAAGTGLWYWQQSRLQPQAEPKPPSESAVMTPTPPAGMIYIPGGTFMMGRDNAEDPEETPAHSVTVAGFYIDKRPVTNAEYAEFVKVGGHQAPPGWTQRRATLSEELRLSPPSLEGRTLSFPADEGGRPVTNVSWEDAQAYCKWKGKRLPTEAEWECAARGTDGRLYPWGDNFDSALTNSVEAGVGQVEPVATRTKAASPFGVLDMSANVWQWREDDYKPYPGHQLTSEILAGAKAIRGGSFKSDKDHVTTTTRNLDLATTRSPTIGFRCAKSM